MSPLHHTNPHHHISFRLTTAEWTPHEVNGSTCYNNVAQQSTSGFYDDVRSAPPTRHWPKTRVPSPYAVQWKQHWSASNSKQARFRTFCNACHQPIEIGSPIAYHFGLRRFVHTGCREVVAPLHDEFSPPPTSRERIPHDVLGPDSPLDRLCKSYRDEAVRWVQFHAQCDAIPGIHIPFTTRGVERYLSHRARSTKCLPFIKCALKAMGMVCNQELHTNAHQQPSLQYQQIQFHCAELLKARRMAGMDSVVNEALGFNNFALSRIYAAFDMRSYRRFRRCHRVHRMYACVSAMQYTGAIRFGLFAESDIMTEDISFRSMDDTYLLTTIWRKTRKSNRPYTIRFPQKPPPNHQARFVLPGRNGPTYITVGDIIEWYLRSEAELGNNACMFPLLIDIEDRRANYMTWLRDVTRQAIPESAPFVHLIRPHGLRAGWATDRSRANIPAHVLAAEGRWKNVDAMLKYIRTTLEDLCSTGEYRPFTAAMRASWPFTETFDE